MRSSKSRSRSKSNRPRSLGNIVNRVFDSSGPEGKVRGTPQQIIDKYLVLARDAQLSNDRVAAENFLQHAEHYTRMLQEAQREMAREAEARRDGGGPFGGQQPGEREQRGDGPRGDGQRGDGQRGEGQRGDGQRGDGQRTEGRGPGNRPRAFDGHEARAPEPSREAEAAAVIEFPEGDEAGLIETPESRATPEAEPLAEAGGGAAAKPADDAPAPGEAPAAEGADAAGQAPRRRAPRRPRSGPRKAETAEAKSSAAE